MKRVLILMILLMIFFGFLQAQSPSSFQYQAVVRDASGNVIVNQTVAFRMSILSGSSLGPVVYSETHSVSTNQFGIVTFAVGGGAVESGDFSAIDWSVSLYFLKAEADISGGSSYIDMGTVQLISVPYALYANKSGDGFSGNYNDLSGAPNFTGWDQNSSDDFSGDYNDLTNQPVMNGDVTGQINSNTVARIQGLDVSSNVPSNGQVLKWNASSMIWEPSDDMLGTSGTNDGVVTGANFTGSTTKTLTLIRSNGLGDITATFTDNVNDADADPSNEIQTLTVNGNDLTISNGNTVTIPQNVYTAGSGISMSSNAITNAAPDQTVTINNGTGISVTGAYPDFTITNTQPNQSVSITGTGATTVTGTYPNFTVSSTDNNTTYTAGTGLTLSGTQFLHNAHSGDVSGTTALTVTGIQGRQVTSNMPANGQLLKWNTSNSRWELGDDQLGAAGTNDGVVTSIGVAGTTTKTITLTRSQSLPDLTATFTDEGSVYTAGTGINITGTTIANTAPDQTVTLTGSGATTVTGTYPNFTVSSTDNNTTYTAGTGLALTGTQFSSTQTLAQTLANGNSAGTYSINMNNQSITAANILGLRSNNAAYIDMRYGHIYDNASSHGVDGQVLRVHGTSPNTYVRWEDANSILTAGTGLSYTGNTLNSVWSINGTHIYNNNTGNVGVGLNTPNARLTVLGNSSNTATEPLFEVKNRAGQTVFIVYEDSVRVYVDANPAKTNKGAFAVSGRNTVKSTIDDYLLVTPDSTRIWTKDSVKGFGVRNIGTSSKTSYMQMTPENYFIGHEAGIKIILNPANTGKYNSFIGYQSGFNDTSGYKNYFIGYRSGYNNSSGYSNIFVGDSAGFTNTTGIKNIAIGNMSGSSSTNGSYNVFLGYYSGYANTADYNVFLGYESGRNNTTGTKNAFMGYQAGKSNTTGISNVFIGSNAGYSNISSMNNIFIGDSAGYLSGNNYNTFIGTCAGKNNMGFSNIEIGYMSGYNNQTGNRNVYIGDKTGFIGQKGTLNVFIGYNAGYHNTDDLNIFIGNMSGYTNSSGGGNTFIGNSAGYFNTSGDNNVFLGNGAGYRNNIGNNNVFLGTNAGAFDTASYNIFIGTSAGFYNKGGIYNSFIGYKTGYNTTSGSNNNFIGFLSGFSNTTGYSNIYIGDSSGYSNVTGSRNVFLGVSAGRQATGYDNIFIGDQAGRGATAYDNIMIGRQTGLATSGVDNVFIGNQAGFNTTTGYSNIFLGKTAGFYNNVGVRNIFIGDASGFSNTSGCNNLFIGAYTGATTTSGSNNMFMGYYSGYDNTTGDNNTCAGYYSGQNLTSGYNSFYGSRSGNNTTSGANNTFVGYYSGYANTTGANNVMIGYNCGNSGSTYSNSIILGSNTNPSASNQVRLGDANITTMYCQGAYAATTTSEANLYVSSTGQIMRSTAMTLNNTEGGQVTVGTNTSGVKTYSVTFPTAFTSTPKVVVTLQNQPGISDVCAVVVRDVSTTGFTMLIYRVDSPGGGWGQSLLANWQAWN